MLRRMNKPTVPARSLPPTAKSTSSSTNCTARPTTKFASSRKPRQRMALLSVKLHRFENSIHANLVSVLKAIHQRFLSVVDANGDPVDSMRFNPLGKCFSSKPEDSHRRMIDACPL